MKRKVRSTFKRRPQPGTGSNVAHRAHEAFDAWKARYGGKHPPITRANRHRAV